MRIAPGARRSRRRGAARIRLAVPGVARDLRRGAPTGRPRGRARSGALRRARRDRRPRDTAHRPRRRSRSRARRCACARRRSTPNRPPIASLSRAPVTPSALRRSCSCVPASKIACPAISAGAPASIASNRGPILVPLGEQVGDGRGVARDRPAPASTSRTRGRPSDRSRRRRGRRPGARARRGPATSASPAPTRSSARIVDRLRPRRATRRAQLPVRNLVRLRHRAPPWLATTVHSTTRRAPLPKPRPHRITAVIETRVADPSGDEHADRDRPAEAHDPQRHDPPPFFVDEVRLDQRRQRGDRDEVRVAEQQRDRIRERRRRRSSANTARTAANARNAGRSSFTL